VVVQIGAAPVSGGYEQYALAYADVTSIVVAPYGWQDPYSRATELVLGDPMLALEQLRAGDRDGDAALVGVERRVP